eukprot:TRINITY_DN37918_c0_g1_i1.p1 TRINITY_DN37918_c0_g1~~TRINITY_DN37918_c0_g1_i1.p1  ORF type:complete len:669 (+),score=146.76 TRINITY_DN37918_c0_g1_i1:36-2042(+)
MIESEHSGAQPDAVEYLVLPIENDVDWKFVKNKATEIVEQTLTDCIWCAGGPPEFEIGDNQITGTYRYDDAVDDEWLIVLVLMKLTEVCTNVVVRVTDQDGQFLLIEAAEYLPEWMDPEGMTNRMFLRNGTLQCIPPTPEYPSQVLPLSKVTVRPDTVSECPPLLLSDALLILSNSSPVEFRAAADVVAAILSRLPSLDSDVLLQHTKLVLPTPIAVSLSQNPQLISSVVRDVDRQPASLHLVEFNPAKVGKSEVMLQTSRFLFAKLSQQVDKNSRNSPDADQRSLIFSNLISHTFEDLFLRDQRRWEASVEKISQKEKKVACETPTAPHSPKCGIFSDGLQHARELQRQKREKKKEKTTEGQDFDAYIERLERLGYFGDNIKGSEAYNEKLQSAKSAFGVSESKKHTQSATSPSTPTTGSNTTSECSQHTKPWDHDPDQFKLNSKSDNFFNRVLSAINSWKQSSCHKGDLPSQVAFETRNSDSTDWLTVTPEAVDALLSSKFDDNLSKHLDDDAAKKAQVAAFKESQTNLKEKVEKMDDFMQGESDYKGVETGAKETPTGKFNRQAYEKRRKELLQIIDFDDGSDEDPIDDDNGLLSDDIDPEELARYVGELSSELQTHESLGRLTDDEEKIQNLLTSFTESIKAQGNSSGPVHNILNQVQQLGESM